MNKKAKKYQVKKIIIVFFASLLLTSCLDSVIEFVYNNADYFVEDQIEKYADLTSEQSSILSLGVNDFVEWHRSEELEPLALLFNTFKDKVQQPRLTQAEIDVVVKESLAIRDRAAIKFLDEIALLLENLNQEQFQSIEKKLNERSADRVGDDGKTFRERTDKENTEYYLQSRTALLENWLGELTPTQVQLLRDFPIFDRRLMELRQENRRSFGEVFLEFLKSRPSEQEIKATLTKWLKQPELIRTPEYHSLEDSLRDKFYASLIPWHRSLTTEQREAISEELIGYRDLVRKLK